MFTRNPLHISWNWQLKASPEQLWPLLTDVNRLFKDLRQPSIQQAHLTQSVEPGFVQLSYNGINRYEVWEEEPYEWEYPYRFGFTRHYQSGPYKTLKVQVDLQSNAKGTRINFDLWAKPRLSLLSVLSTFKIKTLFKRRLKTTIRRYDKLALNGQQPYRQADEKKLVRGGEKRLQQILEDLHSSEVDSAILEKLVNFIRRADDLNLKRIHPYKLADHWGIAREKVLKVFIQASKADLLNFNWDLHCPTCRTIQESVKTLNQIHEPIYCDKCEQEFTVNFNKTIRLSFTPHPLVRKIDDNEYCIRGPQTKPHVMIQQYLEPGENRYIKTQLPTGTYTLRSSESAGTATVHVQNKSNDTIHIDLRPSGLNGEEVNITPDPNLSIQNTSSETQVVTLEKKSWNDTGVSAAQATSSQLFRDLFANEVLKKGEKISVDNLTLMFTDLFDSTGMYNEEGDDKAVGQVINHFEVLEKAIANENGAVVKTIGDSVMAVFCEPKHALRAYLRAQETLSQDDRFSNDLQLKAGIHHGSCVAVNLNSRIDYFGSTVNIASRFVDYASENEAIISQQTLADSELQQILADYNNQSSVKDMSTQLKGFQHESFLIKRIKIDGYSNLRLVI
ncbi:MAG: adenylate/guanylate cyclase domain-containing protein [Fodinibius sp.]|nr:adenylate/guanylate cyclase domain-containing protein [Fodinibius sp.]